jgi:hypothetical protein
MPNMCNDFLALRATKSNETTHMLCTAPILIWQFQRSRSTMSCIERVDQSQRCSQIQKQSDTVYKKSACGHDSFDIN